MSFIREIIGFILIFLAWYNPFNLNQVLLISIFILGFDAMSLVPKSIFFVIYNLFPFLGLPFGYLSWTLILLVCAELSIWILKTGKPVNLAIKPLVVFVAAYIALNDVQIALMVAGIDLLLNLTHKIKI
jgi:hypothetical protein